MTSAEKMHQKYIDDPEKFRRRSRNWHKNNPEASARISSNYRLKKRYGISLEEKEELLAKQEYKCALCCVELLTMSKACIDHDHQTKQIRGILCIGCNRALGRLGDTYEKLERVSTYLAAAQLGQKFMGNEEFGYIREV